MADMLPPNFSFSEMECKCGCGFAPTPDDNFMRMLQQLRDKLGPLPINSAARCEKHNKDSGGHHASFHMQAMAADIRVFGPRALALVDEARRLGFSGVGIAQKGTKQKRFIHLDIGSRQALWSY